MSYTVDMDQDDIDEEKAIQELESSQDDEDSEELWACCEWWSIMQMLNTYQASVLII